MRHQVLEEGMIAEVIKNWRGGDAFDLAFMSRLLKHCNLPLREQIRSSVNEKYEQGKGYIIYSDTTQTPVEGTYKYEFRISIDYKVCSNPLHGTRIYIKWPGGIVTFQYRMITSRKDAWNASVHHNKEMSVYIVEDSVSKALTKVAKEVNDERVTKFINEQLNNIIYTNLEYLDKKIQLMEKEFENANPT